MHFQSYLPHSFYIMSSTSLSLLPHYLPLSSLHHLHPRLFLLPFATPVLPEEGCHGDSRQGRKGGRGGLSLSPICLLTLPLPPPPPHQDATHNLTVPACLSARVRIFLPKSSGGIVLFLRPRTTFSREERFSSCVLFSPILFGLSYHIILIFFFSFQS